MIVNAHPPSVCDDPAKVCETLTAHATASDEQPDLARLGRLLNDPETRELVFDALVGIEESVRVLLAPAP